MNQKDLSLFLALQVLAIAWAGTVFSLIEAKLLAGALAGSYFVLSGLFMVSRSFKWPDKWKSLTWYPLIAHVFLISIPMVVSRFWQWSQGFEQVKILGLPGPVFHQLSSVVFVALIVGTAVDKVRLGLKARGH